MLKNEISIVDCPTLESLAVEAFGLPTESLPNSPPELISSLTAEIVRIGLCHLYSVDHSPVHQLSLKNWVNRKISTILPREIKNDFDEGAYSSTLAYGRINGMEFLGDVMALEKGYLCPAPSRAIPVSDQEFIFASGIPTLALQEFRGKFKITALGRRLCGTNKEELKSNDVALQSIESYLGISDTFDSPSATIDAVLRRLPRSSFLTDSWKILAFPRDIYYGFHWANWPLRYAMKPVSVRSSYGTLTLWQEPVSHNFGKFWLKCEDGVKPTLREIYPWEVKVLALSMESLSELPRKAFVERGNGDASILRIDFPPFESLSRLLNATGSKLRGREAGFDRWQIPTASFSAAKDVLNRAGVSVVETYGRFVV